MRRKEYSLDRKIADYLRTVHGLTVEVENGTIKIGDYAEKVIVASRASLDKLAARIKANGAR